MIISETLATFSIQIDDLRLRSHWLEGAIHLSCTNSCLVITSNISCLSRLSYFGVATAISHQTWYAISEHHSWMVAKPMLSQRFGWRYPMACFSLKYLCPNDAWCENLQRQEFSIAHFHEIQTSKKKQPKLPRYSKINMDGSGFMEFTVQTNNCTVDNHKTISSCQDGSGDQNRRPPHDRWCDLLPRRRASMPLALISRLPSGNMGNMDNWKIWTIFVDVFSCAKHEEVFKFSMQRFVCQCGSCKHWDVVAKRNGLLPIGFCFPGW